MHLFLALLPQLTGALPPLSERDSAIAVERARISASAFVTVWRYYWESSENLRWGYQTSWPAPVGATPLEFSPTDSASMKDRYSRALVPDNFRNQLLHCHPDLPPSATTAPRGSAGTGMNVGAIGSSALPARGRAGGAGNDVFYRIFEYIIDDPDAPFGSVGQRRAICPSWYPRARPVPWDERFSIDAGIVTEVRRPVKTARAALLAELDSLSRRIPGDGWLTGQRVRFALDQGDTARAVAAVRDCKAAKWWCIALVGYLSSAHLDRIPQSDSLFMFAMQAMPADERCLWNDLRQILDEPGRNAYSRLTCAQRDSVNERIWWLADPLYYERGNERRVEHYSRMVLLELRLGTDYHERWDMGPVFGGLSTRDMIIRYGWPSVAWWGGETTDKSHYSYLRVTESFLGPVAGEVQNHGRFATAEYSRPRFSSMSSWSAVNDPFNTTGDEWVISEKAGSVLYPRDTIWWPREHFDRQGSPLVQLWHQTGLFRRDTAIAFVSSSYLFPEDFGDAPGDSLRGALIFTTGPQTSTVVRRGGVVGRSVVAKASIPSRPQLVSLELVGRNGHVGRDRYAVNPPATLASLGPREIGISTPVLLQPTDVGPLPSDPDALLSRMYGHPVLRAPQERIALYWETYGVAAGDTIELSVRVERHTAAPGALRRIGFRLGIGQRSDGGITVSWREPSPERGATRIPGRVPIQARSLSLNISSLTAGDYSVIVSVKRPTGAAVTAERQFWLVER